MNVIPKNASLKRAGCTIVSAVLYGSKKLILYWALIPPLRNNSSAQCICVFCSNKLINVLSTWSVPGSIHVLSGSLNLHLKEASLSSFKNKAADWPLCLAWSTLSCSLCLSKYPVFKTQINLLREGFLAPSPLPEYFLC